MTQASPYAPRSPLTPPGRRPRASDRPRPGAVLAIQTSQIRLVRANVESVSFKSRKPVCCSWRSGRLGALLTFPADPRPQSAQPGRSVAKILLDDPPTDFL